MVLANLLGGFIVILVGVNLIPSIADSIDETLVGNGSEGNLNVTGGAAAVLNLTTIFFAIGIMAAGVSLAMNGLREAGMI